MEVNYGLYTIDSYACPYHYFLQSVIAGGKYWRNIDGMSRFGGPFFSITICRTEERCFLLFFSAIDDHRENPCSTLVIHNCRFRQRHDIVEVTSHSGGVMQQGIGERKVSNSFHGQIFLASNTHKGSTFSVQDGGGIGQGECPVVAPPSSKA